MESLRPAAIPDDAIRTGDGDSGVLPTKSADLLCGRSKRLVALATDWPFSAFVDQKHTLLQPSLSHLRRMVFRANNARSPHACFRLMRVLVSFPFFWLPDNATYRRLHRLFFASAAARSSSAKRASMSSNSMALAALSRTISAARTRVDGGV